jgi:exopolysaccharide biosynthesis WecB/TagA/CpsF family protein/anti-anti-sigma factor
LARYLDRPAGSLQFQFGSNGKPELAGDLAETLYFNLAHSENLALVAVGTSSGIGVDVERVRWLDDFDELVGRFFSQREATAFHRLESRIKPQAFFNLWTRKEAWLKATGEGIGHSLNRVEVTFLEGEEAKLLSLPSGQKPEEWRMVELSPAEGFAGALAVKSEGIRVRCWEWKDGDAPGSTPPVDQRSVIPKNLDRRSKGGAPARGPATRSKAGTTCAAPIVEPSAATGNPTATPLKSLEEGLPIAVLGVRFDNVTIPQVVQAIEKMIASREPHYLITANVDFVVQAQNDIELRRIFFDAHLVLCDGTPLLWASEWLGNRLPERVAGADIVPLLIERAAERGYRLFFLGAAPESLARAIENLREMHPGLTIAGCYSPPFRQLLEMDHEEIRRRVTEAKPDLLFVSLGCPKQEKWVAMNYRSLGVAVTIGVGATIDFLAGHMRRAPVWMQRSGLEWLYRLIQEPRRLYRRYSRDIAVFGWKLVGQWIRFRVRQAETLKSKLEAVEKLENPSLALRAASSGAEGENGNSNAPSETVPSFGHDSLKISGRLDAKAAKTLLPSFLHVLSGEGNCFLDLSDIVAIDSTGVAMLMGLQRDMTALGRRLVLLAPASVVTGALRWMKLDGFFDIAEGLPVAERILEKRIEECLHTVVFSGERDAPALLWQGEITAANAEQVWQETQPHIFKGRSDAQFEGEPFLTIDLAGVRFIDSSGLGLMIRARKAARQNGSKIIFRNPQAAVSNVVRLARLEQWLFDAESEEVKEAPAHAFGPASVQG